jgi:hypothetical protein
MEIPDLVTSDWEAKGWKVDERHCAGREIYLRRPRMSIIGHILGSFYIMGIPASCHSLSIYIYKGCWQLTGWVSLVLRWFIYLVD